MILHCKVDGCVQPHKALGWCTIHYQQWRRTGQGEPTRNRVRPLCSIAGCTKPHFGQGYCSMHYTRWRKWGDPATTKYFIGDPDRRFWAKVSKGGPLDCWQWTGSRDSSGYGTFYADGKTVGAHRWAYRALVGEIPDGKELDHRCRNRRCVNPAHLQPVTPLQNWLRGAAPSVDNARKTHCVHGHELTGRNLAIRSGGRRRACRACDRAATRRYNQRKAA